MKPKPLSFRLRFLSALRRILDVLSSVIFKLYYGTTGKKLPAIKDDILKQPAIEVARKIRNKEVSSVDVLEICIQRIKETNPVTNYFIEDRFESALKEAKEADELIKSGSMSIDQLKREKPFLGVPFTTKDSIKVKGLHWTAGVTSRKNCIGDNDSTVIQLMKKSGAIVIGLTNVPELCMWYETNNRIYGRTCNPYNTNHIVGGSSGGEGVIQTVGGSIFGIVYFYEQPLGLLALVAFGIGGDMGWSNLHMVHCWTGSLLGRLASMKVNANNHHTWHADYLIALITLLPVIGQFYLGSDIGGSIRMPAFFNGIFGHKPTRRAVSNNGLYPEIERDEINLYLSTGPMTRFAVDLKHIQKVISGDYAEKLQLDKPVDIKTIKVFYQISIRAPLMSDVDPDIERAMYSVVAYFKQKHNIVAEEKKIDWLKRSTPIWYQTIKTGTPFAAYIMDNPSVASNIIEIFKSLLGLSKNTLVGLFTALTDHSKFDPQSEKYKYFMKARDYLEEVFTNMLGDNGVFLFPTHPVPAPYHNQPLIRPLNFIYTGIINSLGLPATTVPLGLSRDGLPIGIQVIANFNNDRLCFAVAEELERAFGGWIEPQSK